MKYNFLMSLLFSICLLFLSSFAHSYMLQDLQKPTLFKNEICSYNGEPHEYQDINQTTLIYCICKKEFANITNLNRKINGVNIQCSYERKRRLLVLFFALFIPIGIEYIYLEIYYGFFLFFAIAVTMVIGNFVVFAKAELAKNKEQVDQYKTKKDYVAIFFHVLFFVWSILYLINIVLLGTGIIKDSHGVETVNDFKEVFEYIFSS